MRIMPLYYVPSTSLSSLNSISFDVFKLLWTLIILLKVLGLQLLLIFSGSEASLPVFHALVKFRSCCKGRRQNCQQHLFSSFKILLELMGQAGTSPHVMKS